MTLFLGLLFFLAVAIFFVQNVVPVDVRFMGWVFRTTLNYVSLVATAAGALFALALTLTRSVRSSLKVWEAQGKVRRLQGELKAAREAQRKLQEELEQLRQQAKGPKTAPSGQSGFK